MSDQDSKSISAIKLSPIVMDDKVAEYKNILIIIENGKKKREETLSKLAVMCLKYDLQKPAEFSDLEKMKNSIKVYPKSKLSDDVKICLPAGYYFSNIEQRHEVMKFLEKKFTKKLTNLIKAVASSYNSDREIDQIETEKAQEKFKQMIEELEKINTEVKLAESQKESLKEYVSYVKDLASIASTIKK